MEFKVVMVGNPVGKTSLAIMFTTGKPLTEFIPTVCK